MSQPQISEEQFARAVKQASLAGQMTYATRLANQPDLTAAEAKSLALQIIQALGPTTARFACVYYMNKRHHLGIDDGWRILPSDGEPTERLVRWIDTHYQPEKPLRGLRGAIDLGIKAYARRTLTRRQGVTRDNH